MQKALKAIYRLLDTATEKINISRDVASIESDQHLCTTSVDQNDNEQLQTNIDSDNEIELRTVSDYLGDDQRQTESQVEVRRSSTINKRPVRLIETAYIATDIFEPETFTQANNSKESAEWKKAMNCGMQSLRQNETWSLTVLPDSKSAIGCEWIYKVKTDDKGNVTRHKARIVAGGFSQTFGDEVFVFAPVARPATLRTLLIIAGHKKMVVKPYDVESAYLNGELKPEISIYMHQPEGFHEGADNLVCKLNKSLYGLKMNAIKNCTTLSASTTSSKARMIRACIYSRQHKGDWVFLSIHVDDITAASINSEMLRTFERDMKSHFTMKDLGKAS